MRTITTTDDLSAFCMQARMQDYVTVDTEFMRERTYYSKLCLVQLAMPGSAGDAVLVDPLAEGIRLDPLYDLFRDESVVKVFHAARQDLEIFWVDADVLPRPLFDTQVAAMVCGFGDQVSYETLVRRIAHEKVDKSSRFTDWSRRPLREAQKVYALADVTHLRDIYEWLATELERSGRSRWVAEELGSLTDPETYRARPEDAWRRIKTRNHTPRFLAIVRELAAFRERHAQEKDIPRSRVMKDDALLEIAAAKPRTPADLGGLRLLLREARRGDIAEGILAAVERGMACPSEDLPKDGTVKERLQVNPALADLLRVLLKSKTESSGVAARLIAPSSDLDAIAAGKRDIPALSGWRREVFGADALRLCEGEIALAANGTAVRVVQL
ncbi:ribonuclease D [Pontibaca methylaminivorans]|uniref:ribonuclease D n=1 Tax=Pontibaca methylaminivorans TaxID=515897 RepID=UPI002FDA9886